MTRRSALPADCEILLANEQRRHEACFEAQRAKRQRNIHTYARQLRRQKRRYARMKSKREARQAASVREVAKPKTAMPWNRMDGGMTLYLSPTVKELLERLNREA